MLLNLKEYLKENIDDKVKIEDYENTNQISIFLRNIYKAYRLNILSRQYCLLEIIDQAPRIDSMVKHINTFKSVYNQEVILYFKEISRHRRKSLIQNKIPFIIDDGQIYLPLLYLDLQKLSTSIDKKANKFSKSAQIAYLYFLYNKDLHINTNDFAKIFNWSNMTASRALNELYKHRLLNYETGGRTGRIKTYRRSPNPSYFKRGRSFLTSPIEKIIYTRKEPEDSVIAGLEALSYFSMINPPKKKIRAIDIAIFKNGQLEILEIVEDEYDEGLVEVQLWKYDPKFFSTNNLPDLLSLYLSLTKENDERIEQAINQALRDEKWYMD